MEKNKYLKFCRYYKGEETNPYRNYKDEREKLLFNFWDAEMRFCIQSDKSDFINEDFISMMSKAAPEIRHITKDKSQPIESRAIIAYAVAAISYFSPMTDTSFFENYGKI